LFDRGGGSSVNGDHRTEVLRPVTITTKLLSPM
jgi:hypothetical protein